MISREQAAVYGIVRAFVGGCKDLSDLNLPAEWMNWRLFYAICRYHGLHPIVYRILQQAKAGMPDVESGLFKSAYYDCVILARRYWTEFLRIAGAFASAGIPVVPLKGAAFLADIYRDEPVRVMRDIDILVNPRDAERAEDIMISLGYSLNTEGLTREYWVSVQNHLQYERRCQDRVLRVDLHVRFDVNPAIAVPLLWDRIRLLDIDGRKIKLLSPEDSIMHLALHQRRFGDNLNLKNIVDCALIIRNNRTNLDWDYIFGVSKKAGMLSGVFFLVSQVRGAAGISVDGPVISRFRGSGLRACFMRLVSEKQRWLPLGVKAAFLMSHFLLYDSWLEPFSAIFRVPREQFARFHGLDYRSRATALKYNLRFVYSPCKIVWDALKSAMRYS